MILVSYCMQRYFVSPGPFSPRVIVQLLFIMFRSLSVKLDLINSKAHFRQYLLYKLPYGCYFILIQTRSYLCMSTIKAFAQVVMTIQLYELNIIQ